MRAFSYLAALAVIGLSLSGCSNGGQGVSTASLLDGAPSGATGDAAGISNADPNARPVQVAWTAARAQKCGFVFDHAKLRSDFFAAEARSGALQPQLASEQKAYEQAYVTISARIKGEPDYCSERKAATIKVDLQRHLAGDYAPNLPQAKKVASGGFFDGLISDAPPEKFDDKNFWNDIAAKKSGAQSGQHVD